jgi:hypothetical protein
MALQGSWYRIVEGRRPEGLTDPEPDSESVLGDYFARAAYLQSGSANAFARLGRELENHGAPSHLVEGCDRARAAELRHADACASLADDYGAIAITLQEEHEFLVRPLVAVALEDVVEGFVRVTYGAVVARCRARSAGNPRLRRVMRDIAVDERGHAQLASQITSWLNGAMDETEVAWIDRAMRHAVASLLHEIDVERHVDLSWQLGLPSRRDAVAIWSGLSQRIWQPCSTRFADSRSRLSAAA